METTVYQSDIRNAIIHKSMDLLPKSILNNNKNKNDNNNNICQQGRKATGLAGYMNSMVWDNKCMRNETEPTFIKQHYDQF